MRGRATFFTAETAFVSTGFAIILFSVYDQIAGQLPAGIRTTTMPIISGAMAIFCIPFFKRIWNLCRNVDALLDRTNKMPTKYSVENRLDELERLKRRDMVTPEEYATKRQEILKDL